MNKYIYDDIGNLVYTITELNIDLPKNVMIILDTLHNNGFSAYVCGGACRDSILSKTPSDYDIATSATPDEMFEVFKDFRTIPTGLQHGTITIIIDGEAYECTTYRLDGDYSDGRRPDNVAFTTDIVEDLKRRDFTMNAIAYNPWEGFVDPFNGIDDLKNKVIRCVGSSYIRFHEDGLRILRAIRFAAQLGFDIHWKTSEALRNSKHLLNNVSKERIQSELCKILSSLNCGNNVLSKYADVICWIIPEIKPMIGFDQNNPWHIFDAWEHTLRCMDYMYLKQENRENDDIILRLAILLHDIGKPHCYEADEHGYYIYPNNAEVSADMAYEVLRNLKFSNEIVNSVTQLIRYHGTQFDGSKAQIKRLLNKIGEKQLRRLFMLRKANLLYGMYLILNMDRRRCEVLIAENLLDEIIENNECYSLKQLAVNGDNLIAAGIPQGKMIGYILEALLDMVIEDEIENNREQLLQCAINVIN